MQTEPSPKTLNPVPTDFMAPEVGVTKPRIWLTVRIGSWMLTNDGLFRWYRIPSINGKYWWNDWRRVL
jgi:hypothetical protein